MSEMLKTILFDMGNVLVFFSHERMCEQIGKLCNKTAAETRQVLMESGLQHRFETGQLTLNELHQQFQQLLDHEISVEDLNRASSDIFWLNDTMPALLAELKQLGLRLVVLSNTSVPHFEFVQNNFDILDYFDDFVTSYEVGALKPDSAIYQAAIAKIQCEPHECLYTDDIEEYIHAARTHGLHAETFTTTERLREHLREHQLDV
jgi:HAD superfamily hydrolase (TIGR01509 family)